MAHTTQLPSNVPQRQHWVPKVYLRNFSTPQSRSDTHPKVWVWDKATGRSRSNPVRTSTICHQNFLYSPRHQDGSRDLSLEAHLISPWGTWEWIGPAAQGAVVTPGETTEIGFDVVPPPWVQPGQWWALVRIGCAGRLLYSPAVKVTVR